MRWLSELEGGSREASRGRSPSVKKKGGKALDDEKNQVLGVLDLCYAIEELRVISFKEELRMVCFQVDSQIRPCTSTERRRRPSPKSMDWVSAEQARMAIGVCGPSVWVGSWPSRLSQK